MFARRIIFFFAGLLVVLALGLLFFLSPWAPFQLPFLVTPTAMPVPQYIEGAAWTPTSPATFTPKPTLTTPATRTPVPTRKSPYPYGLNTPVPDNGQPAISLENAPKLRPVYNILEQKVWQSAASADGQKLFVATSGGMLVFDRQGQQVASWPEILTYNVACPNCLTVNGDGSRFGLVTRNQGKWELRTYTVAESGATLEMALPSEGTFADMPQLALSADSVYLAYGGGTLPLSVLNRDTKMLALTQPAGLDAFGFLPGRELFVVRRGRELLFWPVATWKNPANLLLPREDTPYAFSPDGKYITIFTAAKIRTYLLETLKIVREFALTAEAGSWQIAFTDATHLRGYGLTWNGNHTQAVVTLAEWEALSGETLRMETSESVAPDALSALWGANIAATKTQAEVELGPYNGFRFLGPDTFLVNGQHSACWIKLSTGEKNCFSDPQNAVFSGDVQAYRAVYNTGNTVLQNWKGDTLFDVAPYEVYTLTKLADFILLNVGDATTDLYAKGKKLPMESLAGKLLGFAENNALLALSAQEKSGTASITVLDKATHATLFQTKENFVLKPLLMTTKGALYYLRYTPEWGYALLMRIEPRTYESREVARLPVSDAPELLTLSSTGLFALSLADGRVLILTEDGQKSVTLQAAHSSIDGLAFSGDGRYLAISSQEGIKVWGVLP